MLNDLEDIFNHTNEKLLDGNLDSIEDIIESLEECQQKIAQRKPLQAKRTVTFIDGQIPFPADFIRMESLEIEGKPVEPKKVWGKVIYLPASYQTGDAEMYYYRKPVPLDPTDLQQVPEVDPEFFGAMCKYAASMYHLGDDDQEQKQACMDAFLADIAEFEDAPDANRQTVFRNYW